MELKSRTDIFDFYGQADSLKNKIGEDMDEINWDLINIDTPVADRFKQDRDELAEVDEMIPTDPNEYFPDNITEN